MGRSDELERLRRVRRAYELGRLRSALGVGLYIAPIVALMLYGTHARGTTAALGALLFAAAVALLWRGEVYGRAVSPGLLAGAVPLLVPFVVRASGHCCVGGSCFSACVPACVVAGLLAGAIVGVRTMAQKDSSFAFALAAGTIAGLTGSLGCMWMGAAGVVGMIAGILASTAPIVVVTRARSRGAA